MKLRETRIERLDGSVRLTGVLEREGGTLELYFAYPAEFEPFVLDSADPFLPALLVPCLQRGEPLEIVPPVSPLLLSNCAQVQDIFLSWFPTFRRVALKATPRREPAVPSPPAVATLFSGGVDSFYTLLRPREGPIPRPTHLLFLKGLEQPLSQSHGTDVVEQVVREVARQTGTTPLPGESNLRTHFTLNYELYYHGAALVAAALALSNGVGTLLLPSSGAYNQLSPWGSHPLLDPLWSTERLKVVHDGCEALRVDKIAALAEHAQVLSQLRVCLENQAGPTNCGRCRKCVRTMVALEILGLLPKASRFPPRLPKDAAALIADDHEAFQQELRDFAESRGHAGLQRLLERAARGARRRRALRTLMETTPVLSHALPWILRVRHGLRRAAS